MSKKIVCTILAGLVLVAQMSCTRDQGGSDDPKGRIQEYITKTFNIRAAGDKKDLLAFLSGDARTRLSAWSDEQFMQAFVDSKRKFVRLAFRENKALSPTSVSVTYELTYIDNSKTSEAKVTQKKLAEMELTEGKWMIRDVKNIKELVEYQNEMSLP